MLVAAQYHDARQSGSPKPYAAARVLAAVVRDSPCLPQLPETVLERESRYSGYLADSLKAAGTAFQPVDAVVKNGLIEVEYDGVARRRAGLDSMRRFIGPVNRPVIRSSMRPFNRPSGRLVGRLI